MRDDEHDGEDTTGTVIPHTSLSADALRGVIESFVLREGTEYGEADVDLDTKVHNVITQLSNGKAAIVYDPNTDSIDIQEVT